MGCGGGGGRDPRRTWDLSGTFKYLEALHPANRQGPPCRRVSSRYPPPGSGSTLPGWGNRHVIQWAKEGPEQLVGGKHIIQGVKHLQRSKYCVSQTGQNVVS